MRERMAVAPSWNRLRIAKDASFPHRATQERERNPVETTRIYGQAPVQVSSLASGC